MRTSAFPGLLSDHHHSPPVAARMSTFTTSHGVELYYKDQVNADLLAFIRE